MKILIYLLIGMQSNPLIDKAYEVGVGEWAKFVWDYSTPVDRINFNEENFLKHFLAIKINMERLPWGKTLSDELIYHYVIPPRVSQEPLENFTWLYKDTLYNLVKDCENMKEAILKINEWCFTHMEYKPTAPWDQSATATLKRGFGRCEEMTILFMKALRTVGIPVRYVYTPWWPFTESNHAWVEVWTEEGWKFLGSAEPTDLNFAWFREPSKRAGIVLAVAFGNVKSSSDEVLRKYKNYTLLNVTRNYTNPFVLKVKVFDNGRPAKDVSFSVNVWNYSAFVPVYACSLSNGMGTFTLGRTDFLLYAQKGSRRAFYFLRPEEDTVEVSLDLVKDSEIDTLFVLRTVRTSPDTDRARYLPDLETLQHARKRYFKKLEFPFVDSVFDTVLIKIFSESRGNWQTLWNFYRNHRDKRESFKNYLSRFESKDLVMLDTAGLYEEFSYVDSAMKLTRAPQPLLDSFCIPPCVYYEEFGFYRKTLFEKFRSIYDEKTFDRAFL
ncbi:MAG: transglutaminase-like domain-containing protein, partial [bacterium]|nr:transglutaminase-like domain-containing protein [bacterium]